MIQRIDNTDRKKYVSCIKIDGVPILPPLITPEKRKILLQCKQQAIKLEKRLKREHDLRNYIKKYYLPELTVNNNSPSSTQIINTLEQQLSFGDLNTPQDDVPCIKQTTKTKLSCDLQVSQYINNEFALIKHSSSDCDTLRANAVVINLAEDYIEKEENKSEDEIPKIRLIRSNSFTIETPSPILLERLNRDFKLQQQKTSDKIEAQNVLNHSSENVKSVHGDTTCGSNCCLFFDEETQHEETIYKNSICKSDCDESVISDVSHKSQEKHASSVLEQQPSNKNELTVFNSEFRIQEFITNNIPQTLSPGKHDVSDNNPECKEIKNLSNSNEKKNESKESSFMEENVELRLKLILDNILQTHSKEFLELLQAQQNEQELRLEKYDSVKQTLLEKSFTALKCDENSSSIEKAKLCDIESNSSTSETINLSFETTSSKASSGKNHASFTKTEKSSMPSKEEWAASVLGAAVKGYLTRRLLRTDKVQGLIQTIKDTLICAVQFHTEDTEEINQTDVELHRRLIQQVSTACYAFHDVFFSLTEAEKMAIINLDRQKQKEKLLRGTNVRISDRNKPQSVRKALKYN